MTGSKIVRFAWAVLMALALVVGGARPSFAEPSVSGTYISVTPSSVELISLVQTADGRIVGRIESASLDETGTVRRSAVTVGGAGNGGALLLTAQSILLSLGSPPSFSGLIEGDSLELSWQGGRRSYQTRSRRTVSFSSRRLGSTITGYQEPAGIRHRSGQPPTFDASH